MELIEFFHMLSKAPLAVGCYIFRDHNGNVLYVGKSIAIRNRLKSYHEGYLRDSKTHRLISMASTVDFISTSSEKDALILENNLIKTHKPRFNIMLKDDKQYPLMEIDTTLDYPTATLKRKVEDKKRIYFGPFVSSRKLKENIKCLRRLFKIRACIKEIKPAPGNSACLYHQIGACSAPCCDKISKEEYNENVRNMILFLKGKNTQLLEKIEHRMLEYSDQQEYEKASYVRDTLYYLKAMLEKQQVVIDYKKDVDVIGSYIEGEYLVISVMYVRKGNLIDKKDLHFYTRDKIYDDQFLYNLILNQYTENTFIPDLIVLDNKSIDKGLLEAILSEQKHGIKIITHPKKQLYSLVEMAKNNARNYFCNRLMYHQNYIENIKHKLKNSLNLKSEPESIDCFDVSNLFGKHSLGVCIRFFNSQPKKKYYRKFNLKDRIDDFEGIRESVLRRYKNIHPDELPDLLIIDGGRIQLEKAYESLCELNINMDIPVIAISKINDRNQVYEKIHRINGSIVDIKPEDSHLLFLTKIRDEAHRFALSSHRKKRKMEYTKSILDEIPGIGPKRKKELLNKIGTVTEISKAGINELIKVKGITKDLAIAIKAYINTHYD